MQLVGALSLPLLGTRLQLRLRRRHAPLTALSACAANRRIQPQTHAHVTVHTLLCVQAKLT